MYKSKHRKSVIIIIILLISVCIVLVAMPRSVSEEDIISYLGDCGLETGGSAIAVKELVIPKEFGVVYEKYNALQKAQGFDLSKYRTETVTQYTFVIINHCDEKGKPLSDIYANVLVFGGRIIGGEVFSTALDGFMEGFRGETAA